MPNIPDYTPDIAPIRPTETGVEARAQTARRVGTFYNQAASAEETLARSTEHLASQTKQYGSEVRQFGEYKGELEQQSARRIGSAIEGAGDVVVKRLDQTQISHGSQAFTALMARKTAEWNDTVKNADPNDPGVAQRFMQGMEDDLQKFKQDGFFTEGGQKWAESHVAAFRQHMGEKTQADMGVMAGIAVKSNLHQTVNALSTTVHGDPSSLDFSLATLRSSVDGLIATSPNLKGTAAAQVRDELMQKGTESIVKSAAVGYITQTSQMPPWITDPKYSGYVNGAELKMLERAAKTQQKSDLLAEKQLALYNRQLADQNVHAGFNDIFTRNVTADPVTGRPIINPKMTQEVLDLVRKYPEAPSGARTAEAAFNWLEQQQNRTSDSGVKADLMGRIFDPTNPTTRVELMRARAEGKLSNADFQPMEQLVTELEQAPRKAADQRAHDQAARVLNDNVSIDSNGRTIVGQGFFQAALDIAKDNPNSSHASTLSRSLIDWGRHQQNARTNTVSDPAVKSDLMTRVFDPTRPVTVVDVLRAEAKGDLTDRDGNIIRQMIQHADEAGVKTEAFKDTLAAAKAALTYSMPGMPGKDPKGMEGYARFVQDFMPKYQAAVRAGTLPPNALDLADPKSMISQSLAQFRRTPKQMLDDRVAELGALNPTGESSPVTTVPVVNTPADAAKLKPGTRYRTPDGKEFIR